MAAKDTFVLGANSLPIGRLPLVPQGAAKRASKDGKGSSSRPNGLFSAPFRTAMSAA